MNELLTTQNLVIAAFILLVLIVGFVVFKLTRKPQIIIDENELVLALGGKENIVDVQFNISRLKVELNDTSRADKEQIQKLGGQGVVEVGNTITIILSDDANRLKEIISEML